MDVFFDTSVLVAACVHRHPHHPQAANALSKALSGKEHGFVAAHSLAETYAVLTRLPLQPPIHPADARRIIKDNILEHLIPLCLTAKEYVEVLDEITEAGLTGGVIYDALLLRCARKKNCDRIYTFNVAHFQRLAPTLRTVIRAPS